jgi:hypothetical protein
MNIPLPIFVISVYILYSPEWQKKHVISIPTEEVRALLKGIEFKEQYRNLVSMGTEAFPAYLEILADNGSEPVDVSRIFIILEAIKTDRQQFIEPAIRRLADSNNTVRYRAVRLLSHIGGQAEVTPVVALLADTDPTVSYNAATTLKVISSDHRTVAALDIWLNSGNHSDQKELREHVAKCRDELKQRLAKAKKK